MSEKIFQNEENEKIQPYKEENFDELCSDFDLVLEPQTTNGDFLANMMGHSSLSLFRHIMEKNDKKTS